MASKTIRSIPLNRVEGDLEIKVEITDGIVTNSWSSGTMFRGFEQILKGRGALDGLVITPRICGLCNVCHLTAAAQALEMIAGIQPPDNATRVRNVALMCEDMQSDIRHGILMFFADFTNQSYEKLSLFQEAVAKYAPFKGTKVIEAIKESKKLLEIIAILGGQWPHTSFMVPGGIVSLPNAGDLLQCRSVLRGFRKYFERSVLGCTIERWSEVRSLADLSAWLEEKEEHKNGDLGFFIRFCREAGLSEIGRGHNNYISFGGLEMPRNTSVAAMGKGTSFIPAGYSEGSRPGWFDQSKVTEDVTHSWFEEALKANHPFDEDTKPYASGHEGQRYSWAKAPRYEGRPAETGPLAEAVIAENPLFSDIIKKEGPSVFARELARLVRPSLLIPAVDAWLAEVKTDGEGFYSHPGKISDGQGFGLVEAARGALGHWVKISDGQISHYQIITPTAWNASPRDEGEVRGPWEESLIGASVKDVDNPVEVGHVIRSFDSCMVCCVHTLERGKTRGKMIL